MGTAVIHWDGYHGGDVADRLGLVNLRAQALYERLGYTDTGLLSTVTYTWTEAAGTDHTATGTDQAMVKILGAQRLPIPRREG